VADVGVVDAGLRARLADQALAAGRHAGDAVGQDLDRDRALEREVGGEVDLAHAAGAERALDAKVTELLAGAQAGGRGVGVRGGGARRGGGGAVRRGRR
jgi:hypothetical protein